MRPPLALRSHRLALRQLDVRDADFVASLYADTRVTRTLLRIQGPISIDEARTCCRRPGASDGEYRFGAGIQSDGSLIAVGSVRCRAEQRDVATIGYSVLPAFWGHGYGTEVAALLVEFAVSTLRVREVGATTLDENPASARFSRNWGSRSSRPRHPKSIHAGIVAV